MDESEIEDFDELLDNVPARLRNDILDHMRGGGTKFDYEALEPWPPPPRTPARYLPKYEEGDFADEAREAFSAALRRDGPSPLVTLGAVGLSAVWTILFITAGSVTLAPRPLIGVMMIVLGLAPSAYCIRHLTRVR